MYPTNHRLCPVLSVRPPRAARSAEYCPALFFEAHTGGRQIGGVNQPNRTLPPQIRFDQRLEQILIDPPQSRHAHARPELVQHAHPGHTVLAAQTGKLSPRPLLRQHFHQQVQRMDGGQQAQQMNPIELRRRVRPASAASAAAGPPLIDEIVRNERSQQFKQFGRARRRKIGVHAPQAIPLKLPCQR